MKVKSEKQSNDKNIVLVIIYYNQDFKINITPDLVYNKFKDYNVCKVQIISQKESVKSFVELKTNQDASDIIKNYHNSFDFFCKWKMYLSDKKNIVICNKNDYSGKVYDYKSNFDKNEKISMEFNFNKNKNDNMTISPFNKNMRKKNDPWTPNFKTKVQSNYSNFNNFTSNFNINTPQNNRNKNNNYKVVIIKNIPKILKKKQIFNFFSYFGNINKIFYKKDYSNVIIEFTNLLFPDKLAFLNFIILFNVIIQIQVKNELNEKMKNYKIFEKKDKYDRYNNFSRQITIFPSTLIKITNIDDSLNIIYLYNLFSKVSIINKIKEVKKVNKKRFYFEFFNFENAIKILSLYHLKKFGSKKIFIQFSAININ